MDDYDDRDGRRRRDGEPTMVANLYGEKAPGVRSCSKGLSS